VRYQNYSTLKKIEKNQSKKNSMKLKYPKVTAKKCGQVKIQRPLHGVNRMSKITTIGIQRIRTT